MLGQISGADPAVMAEAARVVEELGFNLVDLNFECPIRRLLGRGEGGALMADPPAIGRIVLAAARAVTIPVTVKIRSGPDGRRETAGLAACRAEEAGAAAVEVHARSVAQAYAGGPDLSVIARVKRQVRIPVLGSGGIRQACDVPRFLAETGADAAAIARGSLGNPWIFRQCGRCCPAGRRSPGPCPPSAAACRWQLVEGEFHLYGPVVTRRRLARTSCYYAKFLPDFPAFRQAVQQVQRWPSSESSSRSTSGELAFMP